MTKVVARKISQALYFENNMRWRGTRLVTTALRFSCDASCFIDSDRSIGFHRPDFKVAGTG